MDRFTRYSYDKLGQIIRADYHWVSGKYDEMGNRIQTASSFGANILARRDTMGQVTYLVAYMNKEKPWAMKFYQIQILLFEEDNFC